MESLSDIAVFVQVVESNSFTAAAERLGVSKSVVSKHVTRLESHLGARLLNRTTRRLSLTEAGQRFYERSRIGLRVLADAESEVAHLQGAPRGTLSVNAPMSFGILHVAPALPEFLDRHPEVSADITYDDRKLDVVEGAFDVAIRISNLPDSSMIARRLAPCRHVVCASPDYLERHGTPETPQALREHNVISYRYQASPQDWHFSRGGKEITVPIRGTVQMNNSLALREVLVRGVGIARTPTFVVGEDIRAGRLRALLTQFQTLELSIFAVYPERHHLSPKVRAFLDFMAERISDPPNWDRQ